MDAEHVGRAYASAADIYIERFGSTRQVHADDLAFISRHLASRSGPVLDLGCGPGHLTDHLRAMGVDARGIDLVPEFIAHARATHPNGDYRLGSMARLDVASHSVAGILAWYSLIHLAPEDLGGVLAEFHRAMAPAGTLVVGFVEGAELGAFDHKVVTAYRWSVDEMSERLARAGFTTVDHLRRPADGTPRPLAAIAATA